MKKGFTLIEAIVYVALFSLLIFGALVTAFNLIEGSDRLGGKTVVQGEMNFLSRKIDWALTGAQNFTVGGSVCNNTISITKNGFAENPIEIDRSGNKVRMQDGGNNFLFLTTDNVVVSCLEFIDIPASGSAPRGVRIKATISGQTLETSKYVRQ